MDLDSILSQLGMGSKEIVYMAVTPSVGLEIIQLDISAKTIKNYAYRPLGYNESLREISDINAFKDAVVELFDELKINLKGSNIVLNIPMVLLGKKDLPLILGDDAITEALTSEIEQSYIFKRYEPVVSWVDSNSNQSGDTRKLFYSAIQKNVLEDIKNALLELGANLYDINISLISVLKALVFSGIIEEQTKEGISWNLMMINQTGYSICSMLGKTIVDYYEEPLAIKSFEGDEIYNAINASAQIALMSYPANYLTIVSETNLVSAEILASRIQVDGVVNFIENNQFKKNDILPVSLEILEETARNISLESIGIAVGNHVNLPIKFNFLRSSSADVVSDNPDEPVHVVLGSYEFDISPNQATKYAILSSLILVPLLLLFIALPLVANKKQSQLDEVQAKLTAVQAEVKKLEDEQNLSKDFDVDSEVRKVLDENRTKLMAYMALGESVPRKLWLTYFVTKDDGKIDIKGETSNVEDVYTFYKNMKDSLINTQLRLHKLELQSDSDDVEAVQNSNYEFEITNMSDSELYPSKNSEDSQNGGGENPQENQDDNQQGNMLDKPLLNFSKN